jgi:hypothetical protein
MAYAERRERKKGVRYRGIYKAADGRYRSAGTFSTKEQALAVAKEAERHAEVAGGAAGGLDPTIRATRTIKEYAPLFLRHHQVEFAATAILNCSYCSHSQHARTRVLRARNLRCVEGLSSTDRRHCARP